VKKINFFILYILVDLSGQKYPSDGWFSGKKESKLALESFTDAIGFGFPQKRYDSEPIYLDIDLSKSFKIKYSLSNNLLIGAVFEGKNDENLTDINIFFLKASHKNELILPLNEFKWKIENLNTKQIKHLKFNYIQLPLFDELFIKTLLFFKCNMVVKCYYLKAI